MAETLECLGLMAAASAKYAEAEAYDLECLQLRRKKLGDTSVPVANVLCGLGFVYFRMQRYPEAKESLLQALAIAEKAGYEGQSVAAPAWRTSGVSTTKPTTPPTPKQP